jgi:hypothetical protein
LSGGKIERTAIISVVPTALDYKLSGAVTPKSIAIFQFQEKFFDGRNIDLEAKS